MCFTIFRGKLFVSQYRKTSRGTLAFRNSSGIEKFLDNKLSRFCRDFLSHGAEMFVGLHWLIKISHPKILCMKEEFNVFPWKNLGFTVPKNFVGNAFVFQKISSTQKVYG